MKVAIFVCALAGTALADPRHEAYKHAEQLEKAAFDSKDPDKYIAAGTAYFELYNANPSSTDGDELLYNAGVSFTEGLSPSVAIHSFEMLVRQYPKSKIAAKALARLGKLYGDLAMYDKAADKLEDYAKKYTGEKDAHDAMSDAVYFRRAIGDRAKAIEDTKFLIKAFGAKKPAEAADAMWSLTALYEDQPDELIKHLREYLRTFGSKGGADRIVIAHARIGQILWKQSCPVAMVDGLCVKSDDHAKRTCGPGTTRTWTQVKRKEAVVKEGLAELTDASKEFERVGSLDGSARYYYAQAQLAAADLDLERFLAIAFPRALDFDVTKSKSRQSSVKRFDEWLQDKMKAGQSVTALYEKVLAIKDAASSITAASRMAIVSHSLGTALLTAELPRDVLRGPRADDKAKAYCDAMTAVSEPLLERSVQAFGVCLAKSTELSWFGESSRLCEVELQRMKPENFPAVNELHGEALVAAPLIVSEPPPKVVSLP